jgi:ABC-type sugar transport system substrate-binding protein
MESKAKKVVIGVTLFLTMMFLTASLVNAAVMKIPPKGKKTITIGVVDLISAIEVAAIYNAAYKKEAQSRGWSLKVFDLQLNIPQAQSVVENMIAAGYDGIIVNWTSPHFFKKQVEMAFSKGIPIITVGEGVTHPGIIAEVGQYYGVSGGLAAQYLVSKVRGTKPKIVTLMDSRLDISTIKYAVAKAIFNSYNVQILAELDLASAQGNPSVWVQEQVRNLILNDPNKEIKGAWSFWEGAGLPAAEAFSNAGRNDAVVVTCEDSPRTYELIGKLPTMYAAAGANGVFVNSSVKKLFKLFDSIFEGKPENDQQTIEAIPYLVTKENLPPKGYFLNPKQVYSGPKDYIVK